MKKFLVTGEMRSGTTFMANFLNSQENIVCYADFVRTPFLIAKKLNINDYKRKLIEQEKNILYSNFKAQCDGMNIPIYKNFSQENFFSIDDFLNLAFRAIADFSGKSAELVGIKMTKYPENIIKLLELNYKIIYLLRDPRDVILSSKNRFVDYNVVDVIYRWKKALGFIQEFKNHPNFVLIPYEKFIEREIEVINLLEEKLGTKLDFNIQSLKMRNEIEYNDNSSFSDVKKLFDSSAVNRWKNNKDDKDVILANSILNSELKELNFDTFESSIALKDVMKYKGNVYKLKAKNIILKLLTSFS